MLILTQTQAIIAALVCGGWLAAAAWALWRGRAQSREAMASLAGLGQAEDLIDASPALPMLVAPGGRIEAPPGLGPALGLPNMPTRWADFVTAFDREDGAQLLSAISGATATGASREIVFRPAGSKRILHVRIGPAPPRWPAGTMLAWFVEATGVENDKAALGERLGRTEQALDALSGLIEAAPFPMWHRGPDGRLAMVNSAYVSAVEAESAAAVIAAGTELVDDALGEGQSDDIGDAPGSRTLPATIAGERRMVRVVELPMGEAGAAGYAIDVEDREQAKAELLRFVRAQRAMLDRLSAGVAQFDRDRGLAFFNQPFARTFSLAPDFLADRPEYNRLLDAMREAGNLPEVRDFPAWKQDKGAWFTLPDSEEEDWLLPGGRHLRVVAQPLPDGGLLLIFEDRTEQLALASARDTLLRVRTATFDNLFEAVGVFASDGRLHLWNNRFRELWQFEEEQLAQNPRIDALTGHIGKKLKNRSHATMLRELVRSATIERQQRSGRLSLLDGREFEFAAVPLPDGNALFTMLDVTASRTVEAALRERNEALEAADRLKTRFVANMSYELRTPLTSISGFAEMLAGDYAGKLPPTAADYVAAILESVGRLGLLIDNVLELTQSEGGGSMLAAEDMPLAALCEDVAEQARGLADRKGIALETAIDARAGSLTGDRARLHQAIGNVVANALAFTHEGGRVTIACRRKGSDAEIVVTDDGRGIDPADLPHVFDRFHSSDDGDGPALGLGLSLSRQYVEAHGGTIALASTPGAGTKVVIRLPRQQ